MRSINIETYRFYTRWHSLDLIRAISVISVMALHAGIKIGGAYGVNMFFTLSGFLITNLLIDEYSKNANLDITKFLSRRMLRLYPALLVMLLFSLIYVNIWGPHPFGIASNVSSIYVLTYTSDFAAAFPNTFPWGWLGLYGHTWTLAVEFQFYLIWPLILRKLLKKSYQFINISIFLVLSALLFSTNRYFQWRNGASLSYLMNSPEMSLDSILLGCALAFYLKEKTKSRKYEFKPFLSDYLIVLFLTLVIVLFMFLHGNTKVNSFFAPILNPFEFGTLVISLLACFLIYYLLKFANNNFLIRFSLPLVYIGRVSYGLYLWHFPIYVILKVNNNFGFSIYQILLIHIFAPFIIASLSFHFLEERIQLKYRTSFKS